MAVTKAEAKKSGDGDGDGEIKKKLHCYMGSHTVANCSDFVVNILYKPLEDPSWVGWIWGCCREHLFENDGAMSDAQFKKDSRHSWAEYNIHVKKKVQRARDIKFKGEVAMVDAVMGRAQSSTFVRKLAILRIRATVIKLASAIMNDPFMKAAAVKACDTYHNSLKQMKQNPGWVPSTDGEFLDATSLGYATEIASGLAVSFLCRKPQCLWYGMNSQWLKGRTEKFRCGKCGLEFVPWSRAGGEVEPNKVVSFQDSRGRLFAYTAVWAPSVEDKWIHDMIEKRVQQLLGEKKGISADELQKFASRSVADIDELTKKGIPAHFKHSEVSQEVRDLWSTLSAERWPRENMDHILKNGFWGGQLALEDTKEPFTDWDMVISLLSNVVASGQMLAETDD